MTRCTGNPGTWRITAHAPAVDVVHAQQFGTASAGRRSSVIIHASAYISAMNCACMSVAKPGNGSVTTSVPRSPFSRETFQTTLRFLRHIHAGIAQDAHHGTEVFEPRATQQHRPAGDRGGAGESARFDPIGDDGVDRRAQVVHAFDHQLCRCPRPRSRAHGDQAARQIADLRLARGVARMVSPRASVAAISTFSVPVTVTVGKVMSRSRVGPSGARASM